MVILLVLILGAYRYTSHPPQPPDVGGFWHLSSRPQQSHTDSKTRPGQLGEVEVSADEQDDDQMSPSEWKEYDENKDSHPEENDEGNSSGFSLVDGVKVSPPAPPADTDEYLAICK